MVSGNTQTQSTDDGERCGCCQHSVDVRGMEQIICLAFLDMRHPKQDGDCGEFECKRTLTAVQEMGAGGSAG